MSRVNHIAAWVAAIVQFIFGALWYSALGHTWMRAIGKTEAELAPDRNSPLPYMFALGSALIVAYLIAWLLPRVDAESAAAGAKVGATLALSLIATTLATNYGFEGRSFSLWIINTGHMLFGMAAMGAIIGAWRMKA